MSEKITIQEWVQRWVSGQYNSKSREVMCDAGWYDWFCKDQSLYGRLKKMAPMVMAVSQSKLLGPQPQYVFFKNNCPMMGELYDSFSVCNVDSGDVQWWITAKTGHTGSEETQIFYVKRTFQDDCNLLAEYAKYIRAKDPKKWTLGGANAIKKFFGQDDIVLKLRIINNTVPHDYLTAPFEI